MRSRLCPLSRVPSAVTMRQTTSFNVGNSPLTDLAPWLPYGGKGYDLIVVGLQESTYRVS